MQKVAESALKRSRISVSSASEMPPAFFTSGDCGMPALPIVLVEGDFCFAPRGKARSRATAVALAQCCCLSLALPHVPASHSLAKFRPEYQRQRTSCFPLTDQCLAVLGLLSAGGDPSALITDRSDGLGVVRFGSIDCPNVKRASAGNYFDTTDQHYVRGALAKEAELEVTKRALDVISMSEVVRRVAGGVEGVMDVPCRLSNPVAALQFLTRRDFAVDVSASSLAGLPVETTMRVDVDLMIMIATGLSPAWTAFREARASQVVVVAAPTAASAFAQQVRAFCAPFASDLAAKAGAFAPRETPYLHAVASFSEATSTSGWGAVPQDALDAVRFIADLCPGEWLRHQTRVNDSFNEFVRYDPKGPHKLEHCREILDDPGRWSVVSGFNDHCTEPMGAIVRAPVDILRDVARDVMMAAKLELETPADFAKYMASRYAPKGNMVTVRGNSKLFLLSIVVLTLERSRQEFGADFARGKPVAFCRTYNSKTRGLCGVLDCDVEQLTRAVSTLSRLVVGGDEETERARALAALDATTASIFQELEKSSAVSVVAKAFTLHSESVIAWGMQARAPGTGVTVLKPAHLGKGGVQFGRHAMHASRLSVPRVRGGTAATPLPSAAPRSVKTAVPYEVLCLPPVLNGFMYRYPVSEADPIRADQSYMQAARFHETGNTIFNFLVLVYIICGNLSPTPRPTRIY